MSEHFMWVEKYRPQTIDDYVFRDKSLEDQTREWIKKGKVPHLLLQGSGGTGKSSFINMILNELNIPKGNIMFYKSSVNTGIADVRERIVNFAKTISIGGKQKVIWLEEFDGMSHEAQQSLKSIIEDYSTNCVFLCTTNNPHKILQPIRSRLFTIELSALDVDEFFKRVLTILVNEGVTINDDDIPVVEEYVTHSWPDLRKCISLLQNNCINGHIKPFSDSTVSDYEIPLITLVKDGKHLEAREYACKNVPVSEYEKFFTFLYKNLDIWTKDVDTQDMLLMIIADGLWKHPSMADPEMNLSCVLTKIIRTVNGKTIF